MVAALKRRSRFSWRPPSSPYVGEGKTAESSLCGRRLAVTEGRSSPLLLPSSPLLLKRCRSAARDVQKSWNDGETNDWNVQEKAAAEPLNANNTACVCVCVADAADWCLPPSRPLCQNHNSSINLRPLATLATRQLISFVFHPNKQKRRISHNASPSTTVQPISVQRDRLTISPGRRSRNSRTRMKKKEAVLLITSQQHKYNSINRQG